MLNNYCINYFCIKYCSLNAVSARPCPFLFKLIWVHLKWHDLRLNCINSCEITQNFCPISEVCVSSYVATQNCCRFAHTLLFYTAEVLEFFQPITKAYYFRNYTNYIVFGGVKITIKSAKHLTRIFWVKKKRKRKKILWHWPWFCYNTIVWNQKWCCLLALIYRAEICIYPKTSSHSFSAACPFSPLNISRQTAWRKWNYAKQR